MKKNSMTMLTKVMLLGLMSIFIFACQGKKSSNSESSNDDNALELKVMSFNMRYDNGGDGDNNWEYRVDKVKDLIENEAPDIIGAQEVLKNMLDDVLRVAPQYKSLGVGREDGIEKGEYSAIFYRSDKFTCIDSGYFWLRPDSVKDQPGFGWDAACERIATWAILRDQENNQELFFLNTHLDHVGKEARKRSPEMLKEAVKLYSKGLPAILTGDYNSDPSSGVYADMTSTTGDLLLIDAHATAQEVSGPNWTFHDFGRIPVEERDIIDYIFVTKDVKVKRFRVIADPEGSKPYTSDHNPIVAEISLQSDKE